MPFLIYTIARFGVLTLTLLLLYLVGMRGWLWAVVGLLCAFAISYLALRPLRDAATKYLVERRSAAPAPRTSVHDQEAEIEDEFLDSGSEHEGQSPQDGEA